MTLTVEDDFREFVAARWPDLEGVAFVVTLDAATARRVTTDGPGRACTSSWREALDEGRPGATARRSVLAAAVAAAPADPDILRRNGLPQRARPPTCGAGCRPSEPVGGPGRRRRGAHRARGRRACGHRRSSGPSSAAGVGVGRRARRGRRPARDAGRATSATAPPRCARRLVDGPRRGPGRRGPRPRGLGPRRRPRRRRRAPARRPGRPARPAALVEDRRRSVRRRSVVAGGAAVVAAGRRGLVGSSPAGPAAAGGSAAVGSTRAVGPPAADDPSWGSVSRWAPRGRLATDAAGAGARHQPLHRAARACCGPTT